MKPNLKGYVVVMVVFTVWVLAKTYYYDLVMGNHVPVGKRMQSKRRAKYSGPAYAVNAVQ